LLYEVSRLLSHHSRENQASAEKNGTSKVENIDIKISTKPGDGLGENSAPRLFLITSKLNHS
jgi:hypothetical protein